MKEADRHFGGVNTRMLLELVEWRLGAEALAEVLAAAGESRPLEALLDDATWSSYDEFRALLEAAAVSLGGCDVLTAVGELPSIRAGTMPEIAALLQAYGTPIKMATSIGHVGWGRFLDIQADVRGSTHVAYSYRLPEGFEPFDELCAFVRGLMPLTVRLFGLRLLDVRTDQCQCRGDQRCSIDLLWDETEDLQLRLDHTTMRLEFAQQRLEAFQQTVADVVSDAELDTVLDRIVAAAARNTTAPYNVLVLDDVAGHRFFVDGLSMAEAREVGVRAINGEQGFMLVEIASGTTRYGTLIVPDPTDNLEMEREVISSYARLAATVLDSAVALERSRRDATTTAALLQLSRSLTDLVGPDELAERVSRAMPAVFDCDCASMLLVSDGVAKVAAHTGFATENADLLAEVAFHVDGTEIEDVMIATASNASPLAVSLLEALSLDAVAAAPIRAEGVMLGLLVAGVRAGATRLTGDPHLAERFAGLAGQAAMALRNRQLLDEVRHQSMHDSLTGLPNRAFIRERAEQLIAQARRRGHRAVAFMIDLDGFKEINDTFGHAAGDDVLGRLGDRLRNAVRAGDTIGRLGGDEFVVLADDAELISVNVLAERLLDVVREPIEVDWCPGMLRLDASIGVAHGARLSADELFHDADVALYEAKAAGKGTYRVFASAMV